MKYDFSKCNNLRWEWKDRAGVCQIYETSEDVPSIAFLLDSRDIDGLPYVFSTYKLKKACNNDFLRDVKILPRDPETYKDWQVGDVVAIEEFDEIDLKVVVSARINDIVVCSYIKESMVFGMFTCDELKKKGSLVLTDYEKELQGTTECEFKENDFVLVRKNENDKWRFGVFACAEEDKPYPYVIFNGGYFKQCIPYNEKTWRLLGTTDDYKEE